MIPLPTPRAVAPALIATAPVQPVPRAKTADELAAEQEPQRRIDARRDSSRMHLEGSEEAQARQEFADAGGAPMDAPAPNAYAQSGSYAPGTASAPTTVVGENRDARSEPAPAAHQQFLSRYAGVVGYEPATSDDELAMGTIIAARLETAVNSTLPGLIRAIVTTPVYDSRTHSVVVIPAGAKLIGSYDQQTISGEARLLAVWTQIQFPGPGGRKFYMGAGEGAGAKGEAGISGSVDTHAGRAFGEALLYTLLNSAGNAASTALNHSSTLINLNQATQMFQAPQRPAPTMHLYPGALFNVIVTRDLPLARTKNDFRRHARRAHPHLLAGGRRAHGECDRRGRIGSGLLGRARPDPRPCDPPGIVRPGGQGRKRVDR